MTIRRQSWATRLLLIAFVAVLLPLAGPSVSAAQPGSNTRTFPETGKSVSGRFLTYWQEHGGLPQQGYPISAEMQEKSDTDGKSYTVQYFERAVFEMHPENKAPNDVLLSLLGNFLYMEKYPQAQGAPNQKPNFSAGSVQFRETGKRLGGKFLEYWNKNGGLAQQGFPISDEFQERSDLDGKTYTVQYFERAVFEMHPENRPPYDVLLSQLGKYRLDKLAKQNVRYLATFEEVWRLVRDNYVYTNFRGLNWQAIHDEYAAKIAVSSGQEEAYALISQLIATRLNDRHSQFQDPERRRQDEAARQGDLQLVGIGASLQEIEGGRRISYVAPGGPADRAGLRIFDVVRAINGTSLAEDPEAVRQVRGQVGTSVTLSVESPGQPRRDVTLVREAVNFDFHAAARRMTGTNIAYLSIPSFGPLNISREVRSELDRLAAAGPLDGVIIDIRQNSGGASDVLADTEKLFIDGGTAGYSLTRSGRTATTVPSGQTHPALRGKPVVALVSGICESACEHFAVAIHDLKRGTVLGTNTAGNTETVFPHNLADGSRLMLAEAMFVRADGSSIEDRGFTPGVVLDLPWYRYSIEDDPQVEAAMDIISGRPAATSCGSQPSGTLGSVWGEQGSVSAALGCATDAEVTANTSIQHFERGMMLELNPDSRGQWGIYVLFDDGTFARFTDPWREGMPVTRNLTPPPGMYEPVRGFNKVWHEAQGGRVRERLGWATDWEVAQPGLRQRFQRGAMFLVAPTNQVLALYEATPDGGATARWEMFDL